MYSSQLPFYKLHHICYQLLEYQFYDYYHLVIFRNIKSRIFYFIITTYLSTEINIW